MRYSNKVVILLMLFGLFITGAVKADVSDNVAGWAWSENIGWISFNSTNCDSDGNGFTDTGNYPQCPVGEISVPYGVDIDEITGVFSGYVWASGGEDADGTPKPTIGWIKFDPVGPYPEAPNYSACLDGPGAGQTCDGVGDYKISGWARACTVFQSGCSGALKSDDERGGWDGWIKLRGVTNPYGVSLNISSGEFEGWAWGGDDSTSTAVVGWISFNCNNPETGDVCATNSDYKVTTSVSFNLQPNKPTLLPETWSHCNFTGSPQVNTGTTIVFHWNYSDPEGDSQGGYEVWVDDNSSFLDPKFNNLVEPSASTDYTLDLCQDDDAICSDWLSELAWGTTYYWKVRVKDDKGAWSDFSDFASFVMPAHSYPNPDFSHSPQGPSAGEIVTFIDESQCWTTGNPVPASCSSLGASYGWDFDYTGVFGADKTDPGDATTTYLAAGNYEVRLRVQDGLGACIGTGDSPVGAKKPLPEWKEVSPIIWLKQFLAAIFNFLNL